MFPIQLRKRLGSRLSGDGEGGFSLVELLVVMLVLGILATIALATFVNQKSKASDAKAKESAHSAKIAMETCGSENQNGSYASCSATALRAIEATLPTVSAASGAESLAVSGLAASAYTVTITSVNGNTYSVKRASSGAFSFPCTAKESSNRGGCPASELWGQ